MRKFGLLAIIAVLGITMITGCSKSEALEISGSTSVAPLMEKLVGSYKEKNDVTINTNADGSSAGIKAASEGISNIGMSSRELKDDETKLGLENNVIALDAIGVVTSKSNKVSNLTIEQLKKIYSGQIKNWKDLGGADLPIVVISREDGSGTRSAFEEIAGLLNDDETSMVDKANPVIVNSTGAVIENVAQKEGAIGYLSLGSIDDKVKLLSVNSVIPSEETVKNKKYLLSRNFNLVTKDANDATKKFVDFILSDEGQKIVKAEGYVSIK